MFKLLLKWWSERTTNDFAWGDKWLNTLQGTKDKDRLSEKKGK